MYKDSVLQYILNEEGRTRAFADSNHLTKYVYDYFVKDHLGNVRSTVTAQPMNGIYLAEHELAAANIEQLIFDNIPNVRDGRPGSTDPEDHMAARLNGGGAERRVGTSILLKTMPGDRFSLSADAFYEGTMNGESQATGDDVVSSLLTALTGGINYDGVPVSELPANIKTAQDILQNTSLGGLIDQLQADDNPDAPKAHLNYLFFNDKFELLGGSSGSVQVPMGLQGWGTITPGSSNNNSSTVTGTEVSSDQGGYLLVYVDNQTIGKDVWFDHLMIGHYTGGVMEENHYYPYGLTVQTDVAAGAREQPYKYQGIELEKRFGLETYETFYRGLDPQIGRFNQVDPKAELTISGSPYASMDNNPVSKTDPMGDFAGDGDDPPQEQPSRFAVGVYNLLSMFGNIGRALSPPGTESSQRFYRGETPQNANELVTDAKAGLDMMMILAAPIEMMANESLPVKTESKSAELELSLTSRATKGSLNVAKDVEESLVRVRHHTDIKGLKGIRSSMSINASRAKPYGVDVEVAPFLNPREAALGQYAKGAYVEFSVLRKDLSKIPGYMGGKGNAARIVTNGTPLKLSKTTTAFKKWNWWSF